MGFWFFPMVSSPHFLKIMFERLLKILRENFEKKDIYIYYITENGIVFTIYLN